MGLEGNAGKTKYMVMSQDQNEGRIYNVRNDNISFERAEQFIYMGITLKYLSSILEEIKCRWEVRECLISFGAEYFVFQFHI